MIGVTDPTSIPLDRADLVADLRMKARCWRNQEDEARRMLNPDAASLHRARAETYEALVRDLLEQPITVVRRS